MTYLEKLFIKIFNYFFGLFCLLRGDDVCENLEINMFSAYWVLLNEILILIFIISCILILDGRK